MNKLKKLALKVSKFTFLTNIPSLERMVGLKEHKQTKILENERRLKLLWQVIVSNFK